MADNHGVEAVSLANIRKRKLELEKLEEKSSAKTPKFPNPVPAMKRESKQQPVGSRELLSNSQPTVKPAKAKAKQDKADKMICPWPKCGLSGDKLFLAAHLRVHEKFSNQVRKHY